MFDVSAAMIILAGVALIYAGISQSPLTDASRHRLVGFGALVTGLGLLAWSFLFLVMLVRRL